MTGVPDRKTFEAAHQCLRETGNLANTTKERSVQQNLVVEEHNLQITPFLNITQCSNLFVDIT